MPSPEARPAAGPEAFCIDLRVYYQDTDAGGVVYHANYLNFFERARTEWLRHLGYDLRAMAQAGHLFIVRRLELRFLRPALLDDRLRVSVEVEHVGRAQLTLRQRACRDAQDLVEASVNLACVEGGSFRPTALPGTLYAELAPSASTIRQNERSKRGRHS
ncbi:MAG: tol-pal system-associated acyl-CoA thioesterase [Burkholderiales bacterium]|nr:tol-pal system-associated acyl-CoA thioesterase [Burkholderiales bacterium]